MAKMPVVYVAGPYRAATKEAVKLNISSASQVGRLACLKGWSPVIPHANTGLFDFAEPLLGDEFWLESTLELMRRCDAVVLCPGWARSVGTKGEIDEALRLELPVFYDESALPTAHDFRRDMGWPE